MQHFNKALAMEIRKKKSCSWLKIHTKVDGKVLILDILDLEELMAIIDTIKLPKKRSN